MCLDKQTLNYDAEARGTGYKVFVLLYEGGLDSPVMGDRRGRPLNQWLQAELKTDAADDTESGWYIFTDLSDAQAFATLLNWESRDRMSSRKHVVAKVDWRVRLGAGIYTDSSRSENKSNDFLRNPPDQIQLSTGTYGCIAYRFAAKELTVRAEQMKITEIIGR